MSRSTFSGPIRSNNGFEFGADGALIVESGAVQLKIDGGLSVANEAGTEVASITYPGNVPTFTLKDGASITNDASNNLRLRTNGTTALAIDSQQGVSVPNGNFSVDGGQAILTAPDSDHVSLDMQAADGGIMRSRFTDGTEDEYFEFSADFGSPHTFRLNCGTGGSGNVGFKVDRTNNTFEFGDDYSVSASQTVHITAPDADEQVLRLSATTDGIVRQGLDNGTTSERFQWTADFGATHTLSLGASTGGVGNTVLTIDRTNNTFQFGSAYGVAHIADPSGGATVDSEARTAINAILVALETFAITASS